MAGRRNKVGLDYFELDCCLDNNIRLIQAEFGLKGFAVVVLLFKKIYELQGYYCEWNRDALLLFAAENASSGDSENLINDIVQACIKRDIFSKELYKKYGILTSAGVQKRYLNATAKRERVELKKEYLLLSAVKNRSNVVINSIYDGRNTISDERNAQSREENIINININNIVDNPPSATIATKPAFTNDSFEMNCVNMLIESCLKIFPDSKVPDNDAKKQKWACEIEKMKRIDHRSESDIIKALKFAINDSFWKSNIRSTKKFREKFETLIIQSNAKSGSDKNRFNDFKQQNSYDFEQLEKELLGN